MLGIILGTAAVLATVGFCRRRYRGGRWGHHGHRGRGCSARGDWYGYDHHEGGFGGHGRGPWSRGPWAGMGGGGMGDRWASMLAWRLEASPSQSDVIREAFRSVQTDLYTLADERRTTREDLGKAVGGERFDEELMGELFARHDQRLEQIRRSVVEAMAKVHEVLEPVQRERLAGLVGKRDFGPYRV